MGGGVPTTNLAVSTPTPGITVPTPRSPTTARWSARVWNSSSTRGTRLDTRDHAADEPQPQPPVRGAETEPVDAQHQVRARAHGEQEQRHRDGLERDGVDDVGAHRAHEAPDRQGLGEPPAHPARTTGELDLVGRAPGRHDLVPAVAAARGHVDVEPGLEQRLRMVEPVVDEVPRLGDDVEHAWRRHGSDSDRVRRPPGCERREREVHRNDAQTDANAASWAPTDRSSTSSIDAAHTAVHAAHTAATATCEYPSLCEPLVGVLPVRLQQRGAATGTLHQHRAGVEQVQQERPEHDERWRAAVDHHQRDRSEPAAEEVRTDVTEEDASAHCVEGQEPDRGTAHRERRDLHRMVVDVMRHDRQRTTGDGGL